LPDYAVVVQDLTKEYPRLRAIDKISFNVHQSEIFGLLGPNGAGKTTTIRILLTLIKPTSGIASLFGMDVSRHADKVREIAGYVPQDISVDGELNGYENLLMYAKLYGLSGKDRSKRITEVLEYLDLKSRASDMVTTYSGGMMRRLEIAQALVNRPRILFLDEPSIALDPNAKTVIWGLIKKLREEFGTTVFITTHDMHEADVLCDRIGIMDRGQIVIEGEPSRLKSTLGGDILTVVSRTPGTYLKLKELGYTSVSQSADEHFDLVVSNARNAIPHLLDKLNSSGIEVEAVSLKKPTLDDVFLKYTGARLEEGDTLKETRRMRRTFRRLNR
jgi:ABC-2 type transport system ATP-binding protein